MLALKSWRYGAALLALGLIIVSIPSGQALLKMESAAPILTRADVDKWLEEVSNWGRWGKEDELGTLNLITQEKRRQAAALVTDGVSVSLSLDLNKLKGAYNPHPFEHELGFGEYGGALFAGDHYAIAYHGYAHSHIDALSHIFHDGKMYNGFTQDSVIATDPQSTGVTQGATKLGIEAMKTGILSRGVLIDIPRLRGVPYLEPGTPITIADLEAWEQKAGMRVQSGDVLLVRTGRWARVRELGEWDGSAEGPEGLAGLHSSVAKWLKARDVAVLGSDGTNDVHPSGVEGLELPLHLLTLHGLGMPLLDNLDLEAVADEAAKRGRWEFLFTAAPLRVPGGTGSPINAIATF